MPPPPPPSGAEVLKGALGLGRLPIAQMRGVGGPPVATARVQVGVGPHAKTNPCPCILVPPPSEDKASWEEVRPPRYECGPLRTAMWQKHCAQKWCTGGVFAQRAHSAGTAPIITGIIQVTTLKTTPPAESCTINSKLKKFKHLMLAMGPRDLNSAPHSPVHCSSHSMTSFRSSEFTELPVVENSQLFAQRTHSACTAHGTPPQSGGRKTGSGGCAEPSWPPRGSAPCPRPYPPSLLAVAFIWKSAPDVPHLGTRKPPGHFKRHHWRRAPPSWWSWE